MTQSYKFITVFFFCIIFIYACNRKPSKKSDSNKNNTNDSVVVENSFYYSKIDSFVDLYNIEESINSSTQRLSYPIEDSLCLYFSKLNRKELMKDDEFKYLAGKLLEKRYLEVRRESEKPETFPVYNASILYHGNHSNGFALRIVMEQTFNIDREFNLYANPWCDFLCIDSVILVLDKLPQMQYNSNHQECMCLVRNNKTGGCIW